MKKYVFGLVAIATWAICTPNSTASNPIRDRGFQLTGELDYSTNGCVFIARDAFVPAYKFNSRYSLGVGFAVGLEMEDWEFDDTDDGAWYLIDYTLKCFVRNNYRFLEHRFSPMANVDLGVERYAGEKWYHHTGATYDLNKSYFFITPSAGLSIRTANNLYVNVMLGAAIFPSEEDFTAFDLGVNITYVF